ncbi:MAG: hypothetical protein LBD59_01540 [Prevotellaceae bacterium]|jgi:hypothetical protein|nr:hypothetical protein [Prevotellaceae bacterium]
MRKIKFMTLTGKDSRKADGKNLQKKLFGFVLTGVMILCGIVAVQSCNTEDQLIDEYPDENVITSVELEEFIVAGLDFQKSLNIFQNEIKNIDFSKLETSLDTEENMIVNIPTSVCIEEKAEILNEKKQALLERYPQFVSLTLTAKHNYLQQCVKKSLHLNNKLIEMNIRINKPRIKSYTIENYGSVNDVLVYLASYMNSANYVEIFIIVFEDGSVKTYSDSRNTSNNCYSPGFTYSNGKWYLAGHILNHSPVAWVAHTHRYSTTPSDKDKNFKNQHSGLIVKIYYSGNFYQY